MLWPFDRPGMRQHVDMYIFQTALSTLKSLSDPVYVTPSSPGGRLTGKRDMVGAEGRTEESRREVFGAGKGGADGWEGASVEGVPGGEG